MPTRRLLAGLRAPADTRRADSLPRREWPTVRMTTCFRVAGAGLLALGLSWCCLSVSSAASPPASPAGLKSTLCPAPKAAVPVSAIADRPAARTTGPSRRRAVPPPPAHQLWSSTLRGGTATGEALSPDGSKLFVLGYTGAQTKSETVAYDAATGARLWAKTYLPNSGGPDDTITVNPDGTMVYVTGHRIGHYFTIAYAAGTGRQVWLSPFIDTNSSLGGLAVSPDGTTVYEEGSGQVAGKGPYIAVAAYNAATGKQRWVRYYTELAAAGELGAVAVSRDGSTVYVAGD